MSKKLRNVRRELSGYKEPPAPEEKRTSLKVLKERLTAGEWQLEPGQRLFIDFEPSINMAQLRESFRRSSLSVRAGDELTFYNDAAMPDPERQADELLLYGTRRAEATYRGLQQIPDGVRPGPIDFGVVTGRSVGRTAMFDRALDRAAMTARQALEANRLRASELPAVLSAPEVEIDFGSISPRQAEQIIGYSQRSSAQGILAAYRQAYGDSRRIELSSLARTEGPAHSRRDGFHVNDVSFVTVMREAARREGWDLASPRNIVPTGLSTGDLVEFRHILAGIGAEFVGRDCLFLGFGPTRTLVLITGPETRAAQGNSEAWCLVLCPIPFQSTQVEMHWHDFEVRAARPTPLRQARRRAFELFDTIRSGAPAW